MFSSKADNYDNIGVIKVIDTHISRFDGKGYGIKYILDCLKNDDVEYYKLIMKNDLIIEGANDDIGAAKIVIDHYRDILIICEGILYIKDDDVWVNDKDHVDKLLIDMIGKLDIMFYGADGKRKYHYNTSIKHIKDCSIVVKANKSIINNDFYNDMIKNHNITYRLMMVFIHSKKRNFIHIKNYQIFISLLRLKETFQSLINKIMMI